MVERTREEMAPNAVRHWATVAPDRVFLEHVDGRTLTYAETLERMHRWAGTFGRAGLVPGDHVAYFLLDPFETAVVYLSLGLAGLVSVPVNTAHIGKMLEHVLVTSDATAIVVSPELEPALREVSDLPALIEDGGDPIEPVGPETHDIAMILFTSGTTGPSKGVIVPWLAAHGYWSWVPPDTLGEDEGLYCPMALFHISGLGALQIAAWRGGRLILRDRFSGPAFWDDVRATDASAAGLVGPMMALLASQPAKDDDADNLLRSIIAGPLIPEIDDFERRFGVRVATCYGQTEIGCLVVTGWDHGPWSSCGKPIEGFPYAEVRLVDEFDHPVPPGEVGEMIVRTGAPWTMNLGYYGNAEASMREWRNGWFHTGDSFRVDDDGWYYFVDRKKDAIRRRGENISSFEVEAFVAEHPSVGACAAFAVPSDLEGDEVMVAVVPAEGEKVDPAELVGFLDGRMPNYMLPRYIDVVDALPVNTTSLRVQKFKLRERGVTGSTWDRLA